MDLTLEEQKQYDKFKKLPGCRNWDEARFIEKAKEQAKLNDPDLNVMGMFTLKEDKDIAKRLLFKYLDDFNIENIAEKNTLRQLIFLEVIQTNSIQPQIETYRQSGGLIPTQIMEAIHKNLREIKDLKLQLGLKTSDNDKSDGYKALESMQRKAEEWRRNNQGSRTLCCPHCGKMTLLKIRMDIWESQKHPFFKDRVLHNKQGVALYKAGKITKMDLALILDEDAKSTDYVEWILEKVEKGIDKPD